MVAKMGKISMPQGKGSQLHNRRDYEKIGKEIPENIDKNLTEQNITIVDKNIKEVYQEIFGEALQEYNQKQKRADRKIEDYYEHISKSKNGEKLFYEDVLQWGKKEDFQNNPELKETAKECLKEYAESFEKRNPNLKLIGAYIHMDEVSPHLHLDYVPVAHGYSRGLKTRNSLDKAMKEMGFQPEKESRKNNATKLWKENERKYFGDICRSKGLEVEAERSYDRKSLSVEEYKEAKDKMIDAIEQEKGLLEQSIESNKKEIQELEVKRDDLKSEASELSAQISEADKKLETINKAKDKAKNSLKSTQKDVQAREMYLGVLNSSEIEKVQNRARENVLGKIQGKDEVILDKTDYMNLLRTAKLVDELKRKMDKMAAAYKAKMKEAENLLAAAKEKAREIVKGAKGESMKMRLDQAKDEIALERYKALENKFPDVFKEMRNQIAHEKGKNISHNHDYLER